MKNSPKNEILDLGTDVKKVIYMFCFLCDKNLKCHQLGQGRKDEGRAASVLTSRDDFFGNMW